MSTPDTAGIHQFLIRRYDFEGLKTLCLYLAVDPDNLDGRTKDALARELVRLMERMGRLEELAILQAQEDLAKAPAKEVGEEPPTTPDKRQVFIKKVQPLSTTRKSAPITQPPVRVENPRRRIHKKTGIELVCVPAGPFLFGDDKTRIELREYWIGRFPVTNAQYKRFVDESMYPAPARWDGQTPPSEILEHPVVNVSWYDANAYCSWAGLQLPSEPQWEKAARGVDRRVWPWGNKFADGQANLFRGWGSGFGTTPVGKFSPRGDSPFECSDMVGNVWEWTNSKAQNLSDMAKAWPDLAEVKRVFVSWYYRRGQYNLRGGSYLEESRALPLLYRYVQNRDWRHDNVGFRVVELLPDSGS